MKGVFIEIDNQVITVGSLNRVWLWLRVDLKKAVWGDNAFSGFWKILEEIVRKELAEDFKEKEG